MITMMTMLLASTASSLPGRITHVSAARSAYDDNGDDFTTLRYQFTVATGSSSSATVRKKHWPLRPTNNQYIRAGFFRQIVRQEAKTKLKS